MIPDYSGGMLRTLIALLALALPASSETITGTASVIDGDTIEIHGARIRLHAIDAIEGRQTCTLPDGKKWRCGQASAVALSDKIGRAPVSCEVRDIDRYGRVVAICSQQGKDLNRWLVANGWAVAYRRYGRDYVDAETSAKYPSGEDRLMRGAEVG